MKERVKYCDALRFIAIIMVIGIHCFSLIRDSFVYTNKTYYFLLTFCDSFFRSAVPIFFMLTGAFYLSRKEKINYKSFIKKNIPKLLIPFFVISIIYYIADCFYFKIATFSIYDFFERFFTNGIKYHFWFMYSIIIIYLFIPYLKVLVQNISKRELLILIILIYIFGNFIITNNNFTARFDNFSLSAFGLPNLLIYINYLFLGYYIYNTNVNKKRRIIIIILGIISTLLISISDIILIDYNSHNDAMLAPTSVFPFFPALATFIIFKYYYQKMNFLPKLEKFFVDNNKLIFYIYMFHVIVMLFIERQINKYIVNDRLIKSLLSLFITYILTCILTYLLSFVFEKVYTYIHNQIIKLWKKYFKKEGYTKIS